MKSVKEEYVELCLKLDEADRATNIRKHNQTMRSLIKLIEYLDENKEESAFLVELLMHENIYVRGNAAAHCYNHGINSEEALAVMKEVFENAPSGDLRAGMGFKLGVIDGSLSHLIPAKQ